MDAAAQWTRAAEFRARPYRANFLRGPRGRSWAQTGAPNGARRSSDHRSCGAALGELRACNRPRFKTVLLASFACIKAVTGSDSSKAWSTHGKPCWTDVERKKDASPKESLSSARGN